MSVEFPSNVTETIEIGSQRGLPFDDDATSFDEELNRLLRLGWKIINTYVEGKGPESTREECVCLLGWPFDSVPKYPKSYRYQLADSPGGRDFV